MNLWENAWAQVKAEMPRAESRPKTWGEQVVAHLGIAGLKPKGAGQWKGACPFCKTADGFAVSNAGVREKSGAFNCFKCGRNCRRCFGWVMPSDKTDCAR